ncbi:hypothetical protein FS749_001639 [Ceratobasidium sp. UAMH 11750]|nr:hypothetical protein FS749_001639 [Ceratobasidium sp. UAMH 11750]
MPIPPCKRFTYALDSLRQNNLVSAAALNDIIELGDASNNLPLLRADKKIIPACMKLLKQHCAQSRIFDEDDYGVICISVIAHRIQVNVLEATGYYTTYLEMMNGKRTPNFKVADFLPRAILDVLQDRLPDDPPDDFRTKIGLIHSTPILTYEYTGQLLDYFYCERDLLLRARMQSRTVNWAGWSILFYAMWDQLVTRNKAK